MHAVIREWMPTCCGPRPVPGCQPSQWSIQYLILEGDRNWEVPHIPHLLTPAGGDHGSTRRCFAAVHTPNWQALAILPYNRNDVVRPFQGRLKLSGLTMAAMKVFKHNGVPGHKVRGLLPFVIGSLLVAESTSGFAVPVAGFKQGLSLEWLAWPHQGPAL